MKKGQWYGLLAGGQGFEPQLPDPESGVIIYDFFVVYNSLRKQQDVREHLIVNHLVT